jgi:hypothetical protein
MFCLESSITRWREQMLAAGIAPAALDELEGHLREEITRQSNTGLDEADAFHAAVQKIGQPAPLCMEFRKSGRWAGWLGPDKTMQTNRILGVVWLVYSVGRFIKLTNSLSSFVPSPDFKPSPMFFLCLLLGLVYLLGIIASLGIFAGATSARRYLLFLAGLDAFCGVIALSLKPSQPLCVFYTIAGFITLWLLWPPSKAKLATR